MEFVSPLATLAGMHILMAMIPGPNTVVVTYLSATQSRTAGLAAVAGIVTGSLIWVTLSLIGVGTLLQEAGALYRLLRGLGALYLIYLGLRMLLSARGARKESAPNHLGRAPFATGLLTTLSNPKSAIFWTSAFLVAVPAHAPAWFQAAVLAVIAVQSSLWYGGIALLLSTEAAKRRYARIAAPLDRTAGAVMIALGLKVANDVRAEIAAATLR